MKVGIIGLGLMGASFARTLMKRGLAEVYGADINENVMLKAELLNAFTARLDDKTIGDVDILICCILPSGVESALRPWLPKMKKGAIVTDFCGVKRKVTDLFAKMAEEYPDLVFVGGHPMAGREFSGIEHSTVTLFDKASMIIVPVTEDLFALEDLKQFYLSVGFSKVVITNADNHDKMIAFTSQLCHIVSNNYIKNEAAVTHDGYSAGSYRDMTRVARLDPKMWSELIMDNKDHLLDNLNEFIDNLTAYRDAIASDDGAKLQELLSDGNELKLSIDSRGKNAIKG